MGEVQVGWGQSTGSTLPLSWASGACPAQRSVLLLSLGWIFPLQWIQELVRGADREPGALWALGWSGGLFLGWVPPCSLSGSALLACLRPCKVSGVPYLPVVFFSWPLGLKCPQSSSVVPLPDLTRGLTSLPWDSAGLEWRPSVSFLSGFLRVLGTAGEPTIVPRMKKLWQCPFP